jgi:hypothetical protein
MARSSISGADRAPRQAQGRDVEALGPSDTSDSGSDVQGEIDLAPPTDLDNTTFGITQTGLESGSDAAGTGERGAALPDEEAREAADIMPDDVRDLSEEAEEADDVSFEAELDLAELTDAGDIPAIDEDRDLDEDDEA